MVDYKNRAWALSLFQDNQAQNLSLSLSLSLSIGDQSLSSTIRVHPLLKKI